MDSDIQLARSMAIVTLLLRQHHPQADLLHMFAKKVPLESFRGSFQDAADTCNRHVQATEPLWLILWLLPRSRRFPDPTHIRPGVFVVSRLKITDHQNLSDTVCSCMCVMGVKDVRHSRRRIISIPIAQQCPCSLFIFFDLDSSHNLGSILGSLKRTTPQR